VVEDPFAMEEDQTRERRKGEPATRGSGLRKVYRRGPVNDGEFLQVEVEAEELGEDSSRRRDIREQNVHTIGDEENDDSRFSASSNSEPHAVEEVIARIGTPPLHARVQAYDYSGIPDHDNPWV
jgi:hypothetical protein